MYWTFCRTSACRRSLPARSKSGVYRLRRQRGMLLQARQRSRATAEQTAEQVFGQGMSLRRTAPLGQRPRSRKATLRLPPTRPPVHREQVSSGRPQWCSKQPQQGESPRALRTALHLIPALRRLRISHWVCLQFSCRTRVTAASCVCCGRQKHRRQQHRPPPRHLQQRRLGQTPAPPSRAACDDCDRPGVTARRSQGSGGQTQKPTEGCVRPEGHGVKQRDAAAAAWAVPFSSRCRTHLRAH